MHATIDKDHSAWASRVCNDMIAYRWTSREHSRHNATTYGLAHGVKSIDTSSFESYARPYYPQAAATFNL